MYTYMEGENFVLSNKLTLILSACSAPVYGAMTQLDLTAEAVPQSQSTSLSKLQSQTAHGDSAPGTFVLH